MSTLPTFDRLSERVSAGERLSDAELAELAGTPDILLIGMLADAARQRRSGTRITYLRVASCPWDQDLRDGVPSAARELRITGTPVSLGKALTAVERTKASAGARTVAGFSWADIGRLASSDGLTVPHVLSVLRVAGLDALLEVPIDTIGEAESVLDDLCGAGFRQIRLTVERAAAPARTALMLHAAALQVRYQCIQTLSPLPTVLQPFRPTTGYDDVRAVAVARLAAPNIPMIQVDWLRYGPKLAQVALTFGADDLDSVSGADDAPEGFRRAPIEEVRRNIVAAGLTPVERDGHFALVA
jgi:aminodeoxyfutalosine synthase